MAEHRTLCCNLFSSPFWVRKMAGKHLTLADCWRKQHVTKYIFRFQNIFLDFTTILGLETIFEFFKKVFGDPISFLGSAIVP